MSRCRTAATAAVAGLMLAALSGHSWAAGPGIGNAPCAQNEMYKPISFFDTSNGTPSDSPSKPYGHNVVIMADGYLMLLYAPDSGKPTGGLLFYDVSNPRQPVLKRAVRNADTALFRETHSLPVAAVNGKIYMAVQTVKGIQIWEITNAMTAKKVSALALEGVSAGDYTNVSWQLSWQYPYLFVAGSGHGVHVVDTRNPLQPELVKRVPTSATGGFRVGPLFALGDYLVVANMDQNGQYALLDISDAANPALLDKIGGMPKLYSMAAYGDRIYGAGRNGDFLIHKFGPAGIEEITKAKVDGDGLYLSLQDGFVHYGQTHDYKKLDVRNEAQIKVVGTTHLTASHADHGQTTAFGNLVFIGNDHGSGSALVCQQKAADTKAPKVMKLYPPSGTTHQPVTSRISVTFSDNMDIRSVRPDTFVVRKVGGGAPVAGGYSYTFNTVSFGPSQPFEPDTTYEIVLVKHGVTDAVGNKLASQVVSTFSTGGTISQAATDVLEPELFIEAEAAAEDDDTHALPDDAEIDAEGGCRTGGAAHGLALVLLVALALAPLRVLRKRRP